MYYSTNDKREWYRTVYLKSDHWRDLKARKLSQCRMCPCGRTDNLDVHHLRYRNIFDVELYDLVTLCRKCHKEEHERLDALKPKQRRQLPDRVPFQPSHSGRWTNKNRKWLGSNKKINVIRARILREQRSHSL